MDDFKFILLFCLQKNGYLVILDMTDEINNHPLYEALISDSGQVQFLKVLPKGKYSSLNYPVAIDAINHIQSLTPEDLNRVLKNQLSGINEAGWSQFQQDCYQYVESDLSKLLDFGLTEDEYLFD